MEELEKTLKGCTRVNSPGMNGWMTKFFSHFFDLIGADLLREVDESRIKGRLDR